MISGHDIVCFSTDWGGHIDSSHHIVRRLMPENRVLWVNSTGLRAPRLSLYDIKRAWTKLFGRAGAAGDLPPGPAAVYAPRVIPFYGSRLANAYNRRSLTTGLRRQLDELGFRDVLVFACMPTAGLAVDALEPALVVNYVMDDYSLLPGVNTRAMRALERRLFELSDVVFVTADHLRAVKSGLGKPITVLPHGVEFEHFHGRRAAAAPPELAELNRPLVGFFGLVAPWIDVALMAEVADANRDLSFVFVGDVQTDVWALAARSNVRLIPKQPYAELPNYARQFDVSVMPFVIDEMTANVNPLKMMEYLALGAPVVSTRLPAAEQHQPHVRIADTAETFSRAIRDALEHDTPEARAARVELARANSWDSRVETASSIIEQALREKEAA